MMEGLQRSWRSRNSLWVSLTMLLVGTFLLIGSPLMVNAGMMDNVQIEVVKDSRDEIVLDYNFDGFKESKVEINGRIFKHISLGEESVMREKVGAPELPQVNRSIIIPNASKIEGKVVGVDYYDIEDMDIAPSKGFILRNVSPKSVPYTFGSEYKKDAFYPGQAFDLGEPYILRDYRGLVVKAYPFQYNPATRVLRVITHMTIVLTKSESGKINVKTRPFRPDNVSRAFDKIYTNHFLNYEQTIARFAHGTNTRYTPMTETGDMLIICYDSWLSNIQPLVTHKNNTMGISTTVVGVSTIGNNATSIKNYIQNAYDTGNLAFVLLVGDSTQVATPSASGGASDPSYSKLAGNDDYPEILVGRFSAESSAHVDTQVLRTIEYETMPATQQAWFKKGTGIASSEGPGHDNEYDYQHIDNIRTDLLGYGYTTVDQIYDPSASASQVSSALNAGRGVINYCGHGSDTSWVSSGFNTTNINALTNNNMLPFIFDVACVNGNFNGRTCFAEAWMRATNGSEPTGAIAIYASSINQSWSPPMDAQDEMNDLLVAETYSSFGAICYAGSCKMMDLNGSGGVEMFNTWHVFGDPSLRVFGAAAPPSGITVTPSTALSAGGDAGGPFSPSSIVYTIENVGDTAINYTVSKTKNWVTLSTTSGSLAAHATRNITVSINSNANALANGTYTDTIQITNTTDHQGDTTRTVTLSVGAPSAQYTWNMNSNPGWSTQGLWAWGTPTGSGGEHGNADPTSGHTGSNVYGYNLSGDYENNLTEKALTTGAIDCSELSEVTLKFWRWLGVEQPSYDHAYVEVSNNGTSWTTVWENTAGVEDGTWSQQSYDISAVADGQATVYIRWIMGTSDGSWVYCGWNIDDVEIWGLGDSGNDCDNCDDGIWCNGVETCVDGVCVAGTPPCPGMDCDEANDVCVNPNPIDSPAEYEENDGMLISWGSYTTVLAEMTEAVTTIDPVAKVYIAVSDSSEQSSATSTLSSYGVDLSQVEFLTYNTDTVWMRDYGPRFVFNDTEPTVIDYDYNRPRPSDDAFPAFIANQWQEAISPDPLEHGDGNFHIIGNDAFMTDLILEENTGYTAQTLKDHILLTHGLNLTLYPKFPSSFDATGHIDMWMLPVSDNAVIIGQYASSTGTPYTVTENAVADLTARGYTVYRTPGWNSGGTHYTYTNAVVMNDVVLISKFNSTSNDNAALATFQNAFPGRQVVQVNCSDIITAAGAMHCIVKHVPQGAGGGGSGLYTPTGDVFSSADTPLSIPDNNTTGVSSQIFIDETTTVTDMNVYIDVSHTYIGDIEIRLTSPSTTTVIVHDNTGGSADDIMSWYDAETAPAQSLNAFNGINPYGWWTLTIVDSASSDTGTLNGWKLELNGQE